MKGKNVRILIETKRDRLIDIACRKIRHKTAQEEEKYTRRRDEAKKYLGELTIILPYLEETDYQASMVNEAAVNLLNGGTTFETIYEGKFVKLYRNNGTLLLTLNSVSELEIFKK